MYFFKTLTNENCRVKLSIVIKIKRNMSEYHEGEGWGRDDAESEPTQDAEELNEQIDEFDLKWKNADNGSNVDTLIAQWKANKNTKEVANQILKLDRDLSEAIDDEDINTIIAGKVKKKATSDDYEEDFDMAA